MLILPNFAVASLQRKTRTLNIKDRLQSQYYINTYTYIHTHMCVCMCMYIYTYICVHIVALLFTV